MRKKINLFSLSIILIIICIISYTGVIISLLASNIDFRDLSKINLNLNSLYNGSYKYAYTIDSTESSPLENINNVNLNFAAGNIVVKSSDKNEISVTASGDIRSNQSINSPTLQKNVSGDSVTFSLSNFGNDFWNFSYSSNMTVTITIPNNYNKNMTLSSTSANIEISNNNFNILDIKTVSGDMNLSNITSSNINSNSTSGNIFFNNVNVNSSSIESVSGDVSAQGFSGNMYCKTISGDINIDFNKFNNDYKFSTVSADITLVLPSDSSFQLDSDTLSGSINTNFKSDNSSSSKIKFSSTSGDLNINEK